ncbi:hypothetical protein VB005_05441 [Metarhizium brunneum]
MTIQSRYRRPEPGRIHGKANLGGLWLEKVTRGFQDNFLLDVTLEQDSGDIGNCSRGQGPHSSSSRSTCDLGAT